MNLRTYDAFAKPVEGVRKHTAIGGIITVVAAISACTLFLMQIYLYIQTSTHQSFHMAESFSSPILTDTSNSRSSSPRIPIKFHITFPHVRCSMLEHRHDDATGEDFDKIHGTNVLTKYKPSVRELTKAGIKMNEMNREEGCTIRGELKVPKVGGSLSFTLSSEPWKETLSRRLLMLPLITNYNVSHYIHQLDFGTQFPRVRNPLRDSKTVFGEDVDGIGLSNIAVKIIPTKYKQSLRPTIDTNQISVTQHTVRPESFTNLLMPPGISITYDFAPLMVRHEEGRENLFTFLSSLISIVGGVFVTVGLISGLLVNSAAAVAKKVD